MESFLGTPDTGLFATQFFYALVGMIISLLLQGANRNVANPTTPYKFDFGFLIADNWKRIVLNLLLIFVAVRFYKDIFNTEITPFLSLVVGLGFDKIAQLIKDKTGILSIDRSKIVDDKTPTQSAKTPPPQI